MIKLPSHDDDAPDLEPDPEHLPFLARPIARYLAIGLVLLVLLFAWVSWRLPLDRALAPLPDPTLILLDRNGTPFARRGAIKESPVDVKALPDVVSQAVVAIEDRRFFHHFGIDPRGIARAAQQNMHAGGVRQGGSTITQQLAKTAFLEPDRTFRRKVREALIAVYLETRLSKQEILSRYLSSIYFGDGVYGLRGAAHHYFDKDPERLDLGEAAMLAGMIKAPSALSPTHDLKAAHARAQVVLQAMVDAGYISAAQAHAARNPRVIGDRKILTGGSWFADWVTPQARGAFDAHYGELNVRTTLDARMQAHAQRVIAHWLGGEGRRLNVTQAALVALRPNGEVLALVGGRDYGQSQFNRATQAQRQPGSAFKLFTYLAALRSGATPDTLVDDSPVKIGKWSPTNYDGHYDGLIPLRDAFARSSNVVAARLADRVGPGAVVQAARDLGITSPLGTDPSIALGAYEVNLMELTSAYASLASGYAPVTPHGLPAAPNMAAARAMHPLDPTHRAMLLDLLWGVVQQGTGRAARLDVPTFGKTGTTQEHRDALFVGLAGDLIVGIWVGNDDGTPMRGVTGGSLPARMWHDFMVEALRMEPAAPGLARPAVLPGPPPLPPANDLLNGEGVILPDPGSAGGGYDNEVPADAEPPDEPRGNGGPPPEPFPEPDPGQPSPDAPPPPRDDNGQ